MADAIFFRNNLPQQHGDFSDQRVVMVRPNDHRVAIVPSCPTSELPYYVAAQQSFDSPTYLVIGELAPDEALERAAARYGVSLSDLQGYRDNGAEVLKFKEGA